MQTNARTFIAGHRGLVGAAIQRRLQADGYTHLLTRRRDELDLRNQAAVNDFFAAERPEIVILAAATVGGIHANDTRPADFIADNLIIQHNVIDAAYRHGAQQLLFLGSSCIYPKHAPQPMREEHLLSGALEPTNEWYAIAKIAGIKMCQAYRRQHGFNAISLMPTNLYGPGDNFNLTNSHVLPALMRKFHHAKTHAQSTVTVWGSGQPKREFLHVDDLADASLFCLKNYADEGILNVGTGTDLSIAELATLVKNTVGYTGEIVYDTSKPDGTPRKLLDVSRLSALGWQAQTTLADGVANTYQWFLEHQDDFRQ